MPKVEEAHLEARRMQILQAAILCFGRKGVQATSMQDIFAESKLSPGAVYRYFASKHDIIVATVEFSTQQVKAMFSQALGQQTASQALDAFTKMSFAQLDSAEANVGMCAMVSFIAESIHNEDVRAHYKSMSQAVIDVLTQAILGMQREGSAPADHDANYTARVLYALYEGFILQKVIDPTVDTQLFVQTMISTVAFVKSPTQQVPARAAGWRDPTQA